MYRINLYPERGIKRRQQRARTFVTAALITMLGIEVVLVGVLVLSGNLLDERARNISQELPDFMTRIQEQTRPLPELDLATALLEIRERRTDWAPMFATLAEYCGPDMVLEEIAGTTSNEKQLTMLEIYGTTDKEDTSLEEVSSFMANLRNDRRITDNLDEIELGNIRGGGSGDFDIVCVEEEVAE